ncbi:MAG TPA: ABC transporter substrate-binding protein [Thermoanaerobaculia bacterium]|nr:ABC transporter substrate-binding protein [Thermoanaerobaculia bacterium]
MKLLPLLLALALPASAADPRRGKQIYLRGEGSSPIQAVTDAEGTMVIPATVLRCVNCHDYDGRGKAEGGVRPSNLQWAELTKQYATARRSHPPYTARTLARAITMGIDPAGNDLDRVMPRYRLSARDADDLVAYLQTLGRVRDPGLSDDAVRIGVLLSPDRTRAAAVRDVVAGVFASINEAGGLYGRRIDVRFAELPAAPAERRGAVQAFLDAEQPFALTASSLLGAEQSLAELIEQREVPSVAAFSGDAPELRYLFRLLGSPAQEIAALRAFAGDGVVAVGDATPLESIRAAKSILITSGRARVGEILHTAAALPAPPRVLVLSPAAGEALFAAPASLDGRITVALPAGPPHLTTAGLRELQALSPRAAAHPQTAAAALASAKVLAEALRRAGRDLSREKLVEELEGFYNVPTALTPPITFGPADRVGTRGAWLAEVDLRAKALVNGRWQDSR